jgi:hypothetical protein
VLQTLPNQAYPGTAFHIHWEPCSTAYPFIQHHGRGTP